MKCSHGEGKIVYLAHNHTPEMQRKIEVGCSVLNDVINELEIKQIKTGERSSRHLAKNREAEGIMKEVVF